MTPPRPHPGPPPRPRDPYAYPNEDAVPPSPASAAPIAWVTVLMDRGFKPTGALGGQYVELEKRYFDAATGQHMRALAQIAKTRPGVIGSDPHLAGFVISVLAAIPATLEAADRAPEPMREDLRALVGLIEVDEAVPVPVHEVLCAICERKTSEYIPVVTPHGKRPSALLCTSCYFGGAPTPAGSR